MVTKPLPTGELARYTQQAFGLDQPFLVGVIAAAVVCGIVAVLIGIPTLRLREDYLAIATIGIAESIRLVFNNEQWLANGSKGLVGIPRPLYDLVPPAYYNYVYLGIVVLVLAFVAVLLERMIRSPWGRVLRAIREDEVVAAAYGKKRVRLQAAGARARRDGDGRWRRALCPQRRHYQPYGFRAGLRHLHSVGHADPRRQRQHERA